jgi:FKBP-type peptidyl-prolyl cis-trans isomerase FklB
MDSRRALIPFVALLVAASTLQAQDTPSPLKTEKDRLSYALGMDLGKQFRALSVDIDPALFEKGLGDSLAARKTLMTDQEVQAAVAALQAEMKRRTVESRKDTPDATAAGQAFLAEHRKKPGVVVLPSGLQYRVLSAGTGKKPAITDTVVCHYRGTFIDGKEFDSSYKTNEPATFRVGGVIKGWTEALQLMAVGSKWELVIPPELGYGARGFASAVPPNATLVFEVELIAIK